MANLKRDYLTEIIEHAHSVRYNEGKNDQAKDYIMANDSWISELTSHPFISSKIVRLILIGKPGKAIYLMKQRSKLVRAKTESKKHPVTIKMDGSRLDANEEEKEDPKKDKRRNLGKYGPTKRSVDHINMDKTMI